MSTKVMKSKGTAREGLASVAEPVVHFYMAEDLRQEVGGKISAVGMFPDHVVLLQLPDAFPDPTEETPLFIKSIWFLFNVSVVSKSIAIGVDIEVAGKRTPFLPVQEFPPVEAGRSMNLIGVMEPAKVATFGERKLYVTVGATEHIFHYEVRRASLPPTVGIPASVAFSTNAPASSPVKRKKVPKTK